MVEIAVFATVLYASATTRYMLAPTRHTTETRDVDANSQCNRAAAMAAVVAALALPQCVAAEAIETKIFSSAASRGILREIAPVFERVTGQRLVIEYAFASGSKLVTHSMWPFCHQTCQMT